MRARHQGSQLPDGRWFIRLTLTTVFGAKVQKAIYGTSQKDCQDNAQRFIYENGRQAPDACTVTDLLQFCEESVWIDLAAKTQEQYKGARKRIEAEFGKKKVVDLTTPMIYQWIRKLGKDGLGGRTVQIHRNVLRVSLQQAIFYGIIKANPAAGWRAPVDAKPKPRVRLEVKDILAAIDIQPDRRRRAWIQALWETGARPNEVAALKSDQVEKIDSQWWIVIGKSKTDAGTGRAIPITAELADLLLELPEPWFGYKCRQWTNIWHDTQVRLGLRPPRTEKKRETPAKPLPTCYAIRGARVEYWRTVHKVTDEVWSYLVGHEDPDLTRMIYDRVTIERVAEQLGIKK